jgi:hypothetical protein
MKEDLVIGCVSNYSWDQIKVWSNSLKASGYTGKKAMIVLNESFEVVDKLIEEGFSVLGFKKNETTRSYEYPEGASIMVDRFYHTYSIIKDQTDIRFVLCTDVGDVVFQKNPSLFFDRFDAKKEVLITSTEGLLYKDEAWGKNNIGTAFPGFAPDMMDKEITNAGVLAGTPKILADLCRLIYLTSKSTLQHVPGGGGPDQAALNILLDTYGFKEHIKSFGQESDWACQVGTMADPNKDFGDKKLAPEPVFENGVLSKITSKPFHIVHQYNRNPVMNKFFKDKFGG